MMSADTAFLQIAAGAATATTGARAVAGFDQAACKVTPLFVCDPFESGMVTIQPSETLYVGKNSLDAPYVVAR